MARLTRLFIDAATENVDALPRRLAELGVRYPKEREDEFADRAARALLPLLRREPGRHRPDPGHPRGLRADLLDEPAAADAVRAARQGDCDARRRSESTSTRTFNVFEVARPYARELMVERFSPSRLATHAQRRGRELYEIARRAAVPDPRRAPGDAGRPDRGRLRAQGARRVHAQARRRRSTGSSSRSSSPAASSDRR